MPVIQPAELWRRTGRYAIEELFKLNDRRGAELVLAMTHEEAVTSHVAQVVRSYRDLPLILYHFQVKERDEPRPRAGVLRTREFVMKDSYSFDRDQEGLRASYDRHIEAYDRIFDRTGLRWYRVEGDVGMMGGTGAHEYMAPCAAGENEVALAPGYAANVEVARAATGKAGTCATARCSTAAPSARAGDRGRQHLPARHALLGAARRELPRRARRRAADLDGLLRDRPGAHRGGRGRAVRRRARHLLAGAIAPFAVHLVALGRPGTPERDAAERVYATLRDGGVEVLYDDRDAGAGEKFADAELLGCPLRLTVGRRSLESGEIEVQLRRGRRSAPGLPLGADPEALLRAVEELWQSLP